MKPMTKEEHKQLEDQLVEATKQYVKARQSIYEGEANDAAFQSLLDASLQSSIEEESESMLKSLIEHAEALGLEYRERESINWSDISWDEKKKRIPELDFDLLKNKLNETLENVESAKRASVLAKPTYLQRFVDFFIGIANLFGAKIKTYQDVAQEKQTTFEKAQQTYEKMITLKEKLHPFVNALVNAQAEFSFNVTARGIEPDDQNTPLASFTQSYMEKQSAKNAYSFKNNVSPHDEIALRSTMLTVAELSKLSPYIEKGYFGSVALKYFHDNKPSLFYIKDLEHIAIRERFLQQAKDSQSMILNVSDKPQNVELDQVLPTLIEADVIIRGEVALQEMRAQNPSAFHQALISGVRAAIATGLKETMQSSSFKLSDISAIELHAPGLPSVRVKISDIQLNPDLVLEDLGRRFEGTRPTVTVVTRATQTQQITSGEEVVTDLTDDRVEELYDDEDLTEKDIHSAETIFSANDEKSSISSPKPASLFDNVTTLLTMGYAIGSQIFSSSFNPLSIFNQSAAAIKINELLEIDLQEPEQEEQEIPELVTIEEKQEIPEPIVSEEKEEEKQQLAASNPLPKENQPHAPAQEKRDAYTAGLERLRRGARGGDENEEDIEEDDDDEEEYQQQTIKSPSVTSPAQKSAGENRPSLDETVHSSSDAVRSQDSQIKIELISPLEFNNKRKKLDPDVLYVARLQKEYHFKQLNKPVSQIKIDAMPGDAQTKSSLSFYTNDKQIQAGTPQYQKVQGANKEYLSKNLDAILKLIEDQQTLQLEKGAAKATASPRETPPKSQSAVDGKTVLSYISKAFEKSTADIENVKRRNQPESSTGTMMSGLSRSRSSSNEFNDMDDVSTLSSGNSTPRASILSSTLTANEKSNTKNQLLSIQLQGQNCNLIKSDTFNDKASQDKLKRLVEGAEYAIVLNNEQLYYIAKGFGDKLTVKPMEPTALNKIEFNQIKDIIKNFEIETGLSRKATPDELPLAVIAVTGWKKPPEEIMRETIVAGSAESIAAGANALVASAAENKQFKGALMACQGVLSIENTFTDAKSKEIATEFCNAIKETKISKNTFDGDLNEVKPNILQFYSRIRPYIDQNPQLSRLYAFLNKSIKDDGKNPTEKFVAVIQTPPAQTATPQTEEAAPSSPMTMMTAGLLNQIKQPKNMAQPSSTKVPVSNTTERAATPTSTTSDKENSDRKNLFSALTSGNPMQQLKSRQTGGTPNTTNKYKEGLRPTGAEDPPPDSAPPRKR